MKALQTKKSKRPVRRTARRKPVIHGSGGAWTAEHESSFDVFVESVQMLAANEPDLRKKYAGEWVAIHHGKIVLHSSKVDDLVAKLGKHDLKLEEVLIHKIVRHPRALVV